MSMVQEKMYMDVDDVCAILGVSKTYAWKFRCSTKQRSFACHILMHFLEILFQIIHWLSALYLQFLRHLDCSVDHLHCSAAELQHLES